MITYHSLIQLNWTLVVGDKTGPVRQEKADSGQALQVKEHALKTWPDFFDQTR